MPKSPGPKKKEKEKDKKKEDEKQKSTEKVKKPNPVESGEHSPSDSENEEPNSPPPGKANKPNGGNTPVTKDDMEHFFQKNCEMVAQKMGELEAKMAIQRTPPPPRARSGGRNHRSVSSKRGLDEKEQNPNAKLKQQKLLFAAARSQFSPTSRNAPGTSTLNPSYLGQAQSANQTHNISPLTVPHNWGNYSGPSPTSNQATNPQPTAPNPHQQGNTNPPTNAWSQGPPPGTTQPHHTPAPPLNFDAKALENALTSLNAASTQAIASIDPNNSNPTLIHALNSVVKAQHEIFAIMSKFANSVQGYVVGQVSKASPDPKIVNKINNLNTQEIHHTVNRVRTTDREKEIEKSLRSARVFKIPNRQGEHANEAVKRAFEGHTIYSNALHNCKCFYLGKQAENPTVPIVVEFSDVAKKTEFMNELRKNEENLPFTASIHWPKDLASRIKVWKATLEKSSDHQGSQFYFSYNSNRIRISKRPDNNTNCKWEEIHSFPIPPKNAATSFRGLPCELGGPPSNKQNEGPAPPPTGSPVHTPSPDLSPSAPPSESMEI